MVTSSPRSFGEVLRRYRTAAGLTQEELAEKSGLSARAVSDLERGVKQRPRRDTLQFLSDALTLSVPERALLESLARRRPAGEAEPSAEPTRSARDERVVDPVPNNLPSLLTPLVGRERDVAAARAAILQPAVRLLTITGPGGIGKTRLSIEVASGLTEAFEDGVFLVRLAEVADPTLVVPTIAQSLGVAESPGRSIMATLKANLRTRALLLLVDNFERLLAATPVLAELLQDCPRLKLLVTSREVLHLAGEREFSLLPLTLPDLSRLPPPAQLAQFEAIALFLQRAVAVRPDFVLTQDNGATVARICQRLDGLPLAIELATARLKVLSLHELDRWLETRLAHLGRGPNDLYRSFAWSYDLLSPGEQELFRRLAVFAGGFTLDAAEAVCNLDDSSDFDTVDGAASLVDKSLILREETPDGGSRFRMLAVIREFARERLAASGEDDAARRRHADYFLDLARSAEPHLRQPGPGAWLELLDREQGNLRAALRYFVDRPDVERGLELAGALRWFWWERGLLSEGKHWCAELLSLPSAGARTAARAKVLNTAGFLDSGSGDSALVTAWSEEARSIYRELGDAAGEAWSLAFLAVVGTRHGESLVARSFAEESLAIFRELDDRDGIMFALGYLGIVALDLEDDTRLTETLTEAGALARQAGSADGLSRALSALGHGALYLRGDVRAARDYYRGCLQALIRPLQPFVTLYTLEGLAAVAAREGQITRAVRLAEATAALRETFGMAATPRMREKFSRLYEPAREALSLEERALARAEGRAMTIEQAVAYALSEQV